ncbi:AraC family transcriptional regulator [Lachnospiraceae bacterium]|nr:AraC family transcriptional regulator [Lachnospiraceae bacterium]
MKPNYSKMLTFRSFLTSYILVCAILLGITGVGYAGSMVSLKQERERFADLQVREISQQVADYIERTYQAFDVLEAEQQFREAAQLSGETVEWEILSSLELKTLMSRLDAKNGLYQNLHVYFANSNSVVSAETQRWEQDTGIMFFCRQYGLEKEEFDRLMHMEDGRYYAILKGSVIWFLQPVYEEGEILAVIFAEYSGQRLIGGNVHENTILLHTQEGENLLCAGSLPKDALEGVLAEDTEAGKKIQKIKIAGKSYIGIGAQVELFHMKLYVLLPEAEYFSQFRRALLILIAEFFFMAILAALLSWYLSQKMYVPVGNLIQDNHRLQGRINKNSRILKNLGLAHYLEGVEQAFPSPGSGVWEQLTNEDGEEYYQMAVIVPEKKEDGFRPLMQKGQGEENPAWIVVWDVLKERAFGTCQGLVLPVGRQYVVIVSRRRSDEGEQERMRGMFEVISNIFLELFQMPVCILAGVKERGFDQMKRVYDSLLEGLLYLDFWNHDGERRAGVYMYGEMLQNEGDFQFSDYINGSKKLLNCLESEDFHGANRELDLLFQKTFPKNQKYLKYNLYRMYGLIGILITVLNTSADEEEQKFYDSLHCEERLFRIQSMDELVRESHDIFERMIQYKENSAAEKRPEWLEEMLHYIREHAADYDMNVSSLANRFGMSVPHLSRSFKTWTGMGALEYIHRAKIELAKEMLKNDCSVKNAAFFVGYSDMQALTRAFKRYEGITPSQYKEQVSKNEA